MCVEVDALLIIHMAKGSSLAVRGIMEDVKCLASNLPQVIFDCTE